jgi:predicted PurR-regulated permease PerM
MLRHHSLASGVVNEAAPLTRVSPFRLAAGSTFRQVTSDDRSADGGGRVTPDDDPLMGEDEADDRSADVGGTDDRRRRDDDATGPTPRRDNWGRRVNPDTGRPFDRRQTDRILPRWAVPAIAIFWLGSLLSMVAHHVFGRLSGLLLLLLISVFITFAIEPGVNRLARRGWRRGTATLTILMGVLVTFLVFVIAIGALVGSQVADLLAESETYISDSVGWINSTFGTQIDPQAVVDEFNDPNGRVQEFIQSQGDEAVRVSLTAVSVIFQGLSVLLFTFYLVADGPRMRRAICSRLRPSRQEVVLRTWDIAITKTGGYLYSRALLALLSALSHWVLFQTLGTPAPIALALWVGLFSQFLPVVGTYIAGVLPILVTLVDSPVDATIVLIFIIFYQQVENFLLTPRITSRTMELHPALAFGAALGGAALLGAIGAVLALPAVAMAQALVTGWGQRYDVVDNRLTEMVEPTGIKIGFRKK